MFLNSALTKEVGTFTAYLARSASAVAAQTVSGATLLYSGYDIVSYLNCTMDTHIAPVGWNVTGGNPPGANLGRAPWPAGASTAPGRRAACSSTSASVLRPIGRRSCMAPRAAG